MLIISVKKITILREPTANFISSWRYYRAFNIKLRESLPLYRSKPVDQDHDKPDVLAEIEQFLEDPNYYLKNYNFQDGAFMFLFQPQFIFFGYPTYLIRSIRRGKVESLVRNWIKGVLVQDGSHKIRTIVSLKNKLVCKAHSKGLGSCKTNFSFEF